MTHWLGIDLGTSAAKAVLVDDAGTVVAIGEAPVATARPRPGWSEQDPADWWRAVEAAVASVAASAGPAWRHVGAIGLSGQMHGAVLLGADDRPLGPVMLWNDARAAAEAAELRDGHPDLCAPLGVRPMAGLTAPKLLWLARHDPARLAATRHLVSPKDYVRLVLTGAVATDVSDAAGTWLLDQAARSWSPAAAEAIGVDTSILPCLHEGPDLAGRLRPEIAALWNLPVGLPVAAGGGDAAAGAIGIGAVEPGAAFVSLGTSGQVLAVAAGHSAAPDAVVHAFCHALPARWYRMGAILTGASALVWAAGLVGSTPGALAAAAETVPPERAGRLLFLPYLTGERTPHDDPMARGVLFGLTPETDRAELARAVMEGVAFAIADAAAALAAAGTRPETFGFVGGGARSRLWARLLAAALGRPVVRWRGAEAGPAVGAAILGRMAATGQSAAEAAPRPFVLDVSEPEPDLVAAGATTLPRWRALYCALAPEFRRG